MLLNWDPCYRWHQLDGSQLPFAFFLAGYPCYPYITLRGYSYTLIEAYTLTYLYKRHIAPY